MKGFILVIGMMLIFSATAQADVRIGSQAAPEGVQVIELEYLTEKYSLLLEQRSLKDFACGGTAYDLSLTTGLVRVYSQGLEGGAFLGLGVANFRMTDSTSYTGSAQNPVIDAGYRFKLWMVSLDLGLRSYFAGTFKDSQGQEATMEGVTGILAGVGLQF